MIQPFFKSATRLALYTLIFIGCFIIGNYIAFPLKAQAATLYDVPASPVDAGPYSGVFNLNLDASLDGFGFIQAGEITYLYLYLYSGDSIDGSTEIYAERTTSGGTPLDCRTPDLNFFGIGGTIGAVGTSQIVEMGPFSGTDCTLSGTNNNNIRLRYSLTGTTGFLGAYGNASFCFGSACAWYRITDSSDTPPTETGTRIETVTPPDGSLNATSTSFTFAVTGYVSEGDFVDNMKVKMRYSNGGFESTQMVGPIFAFMQQPDSTGEFIWDITESGPFSFSTTTNMQIIGNYSLDTRVTAPRFTIFGSNFLERNLAATSTDFIVATSTAFGTLRQQVQHDLDVFAGTASSTINTSVCNPISGNFSIVPCITILFVPSPESLKQSLDDLHDTVLVKFPWGYATRFISIMTGTASSTPLPTWSATINVGPGSDNTPEHITLEWDMQEMIAGGANLLSNIEDTRGYGVNLRDVTQPYVQLAVAFFVLSIIWHDIMSMGHQARRNRNSS